MRILNILVRRYLSLDEIDAAVSFYEALIGQKRRLAFDYPEHDLKLAQVASILFIAGTDESLAPFRATEATFMVEDLDAFAAHLPTTGSTILEAAKPVPTGRTCWCVTPMACWSNMSNTRPNILPTSWPPSTDAMAA